MPQRFLHRSPLLRPGQGTPPGTSRSTAAASSESAAHSPTAPTAPTTPAAPAATGAPAATSLPAATGATAGKGPFKVSGYVFYEYGLPAAGVVARLYMRGFGAALTKLGEITTDLNGYYAIAYNSKSAQRNLEVCVVDKSGHEVRLCDTNHAAARAESLDLVAPNSLRPIDAEFTRISTDIAREIGGLQKLATCREDEEQKDLTILADLPNGMRASLGSLRVPYRSRPNPNWPPSSYTRSCAPACRQTQITSPVCSFHKSRQGLPRPCRRTSCA